MNKLNLKKVKCEQIKSKEIQSEQVKSEQVQCEKVPHSGCAADTTQPKLEGNASGDTHNTYLLYAQYSKALCTILKGNASGHIRTILKGLLHNGSLSIECIV